MSVDITRAPYRKEMGTLFVCEIVPRIRIMLYGLCIPMSWHARPDLEHAAISS